MVSEVVIAPGAAAGGSSIVSRSPSPFSPVTVKLTGMS
jgi:hypothetical protein